MKGFKLKIENPCEQNWEEMNPAEGGKYCVHCSKNVVDFTSLSDREIIQHISKSSGRICGRLSTEQLNRVIVDKDKTATPSLFPKIAASFLFFWMSQQASALPLKKSAVIEIEFHLPLIKDIYEQKETVLGDSTYIIKGKILDAKTKESLPAATVLIMGTTQGTATNMEGYFQLAVPTNSKSVVVVSYIGYESQKLTIDPAEDMVYEILLNVDSKSFYPIGEIEIKLKWWHFGKRWKYRKRN